MRCDGHDVSAGARASPAYTPLPRGRRPNLSRRDWRAAEPGPRISSLDETGAEAVVMPRQRAPKEPNQRRDAPGEEKCGHGRANALLMCDTHCRLHVTHCASPGAPSALGTCWRPTLP